ncbi:hypothetical protein RRG08_045125 [Elysia crispata]|uniref:Uncharacterized protein n=1 Tax=Elysia crispata TaxID=231223 RepID=A0AAE1D4X9_9GAST|nr:hypothetical protein RRG08_045125 [Elysia crispata]
MCRFGLGVVETNKQNKLKKRSQVRGLTGTNLSLPDRLNAPWRSVGLSGRTVDGKENKVPQDCAKVNIHARRSVYEVPVASVRGWQQQLMKSSSPGELRATVPVQRRNKGRAVRQLAIETKIRKKKSPVPNYILSLCFGVPPSAPDHRGIKFESLALSMSHLTGV